MSALSVASVVAVQVIVWSLGQLPVGQATMVQYTQQINSTGRASFVIPTYGVYLVSATVDPDYDTNAVYTLVVKKNDLTMFTLNGRKIVANTGMFNQMNSNDVITVEGTGIRAGENNRLSVAFVSNFQDHRAIMTTGDNVLYQDRQAVQFTRQWNANRGWIPRSQDYLLVQNTGVYWVTAWINPPSHGAAFSVTLSHMGGYFDLYDVFTVWADLGRSVSCSGAVLVTRMQRLKLTAQGQEQRLFSESLLSIAYLSGNRGRALTGRMFLPSNGAGCQKECQNPNIYLASRGRRSTHYTDDKRNARHGYQNKRHDNTKHSVHTRSSPRPGNNLAIFVLRWIDELFIENEGNMAVRGGSTVTIPATGVYLVGIRPDSARGENISIVMHKNSRFIWQTFAEGTPSGETFAMTFNQSDSLIFYAYGSCTVERTTLVSVAFVQG